MITKQDLRNQKLITNRYINGQLAVFVKNEQGEPVAELSLASNTIDLEPNEFILKDYSENEEIANELINLGLIHFSERFVLIGSHLCPVCQIIWES